MPIVNNDAKSLEWCTYLFLSQDETGIKEWNNVVKYPDKYPDIHTSNQNTFKLPTRLIAKILLFRAIYADPEKAAFAYSKDPDFAQVSKKVNYWQDVLDNFFKKYSGLKKKHIQFIQQATTTGKIVSPFGREYIYEPRLINGEYKWSIPDILNWPNQGLGADVMAIVRIVTQHGRKKRNIRGDFISTVHDSVVFDVPSADVDKVAILMRDVYEHLPYYIEKYLGVKWNVVMLGETSVGPNLKDLTEYKI